MQCLLATFAELSDLLTHNKHQVSGGKNSNKKSRIRETTETN